MADRANVGVHSKAAWARFQVYGALFLSHALELGLRLSDLIPTGERSGLQTRIRATKSVAQKKSASEGRTTLALPLVEGLSSPRRQPDLKTLAASLGKQGRLDYVNFGTYVPRI
jgi:hypothetical protein